jgi:lipopolysaccharide export system permease protein
MTFGELRNNLADTKTTPQMRREIRLELQRRFALPFACLVFALAGVPLGMQNQRSGKAGGYSLAIGVIIFYYILLSIGKNLGEKGLIDSFSAMWTPNIVFTVFGLYAFRMAAEERPLPLVQRFRIINERLRGFFSRSQEER